MKMSALQTYTTILVNVSMLSKKNWTQKYSGYDPIYRKYKKKAKVLASAAHIPKLERYRED